LIWIELKKFRKEYINVSETFKNKKQVSQDSIGLKEEVEILQRALSVSNFINTITVKPLYLERVDNWFLKPILYYFNRYIFKNQLSTLSR
jgi:hypothetical protein